MIRFIGRLVRGIAYGTVILAVIVGAPWLLLAFFGSPVPTSVPDAETVREWFDQPNTGPHLFAVVLLIVWAGWAVFTYIIAVEVYAAIRRVQTPRIRLATPLHSVAAGLVGAAATAISSAAANAAPPPAPVDAAVATVPDQPAARAATTPAPATGQEHAQAGAGQPDHADTDAAQRYRVAEGDWLVGIAERFLGDADAYPRIAALNPDLEDRDPRFPDHIEPGWQLTLPPDTRDQGPVRHATGTLIDPVSPQASEEADKKVPEQVEPPAPDPAPTTPPDPTPPTSPTPTQSTTPAPGPSASPPTVSVYPYQDDVDEDEDGDGDVMVVGGSRIGAMSGAGLLASLALLALQAERRRQTQHRRPGQRLPNPRGGATERDLRIAEAPADVERLDLALRHLGAALADHPTPPDIIGARLAGGDVHLLLAADGGTPPEPWLDEGNHWVLPGSTPLPILPMTDRPLPTLTAVGSQAGRHLLLDLERHATLTITGDADRAIALLRYMVCELACNTWSEDAEILVAGFADHEAAWLKELNPSRVLVAASVSDAAAQLRRHITATRRALDALSLPDTLHGRLRGVAVDAWTPHVLLVANPDPNDYAALAALNRELVAAGRCGAAVVATAPAGPPVGAAAITVAADATLTIAVPHLRSSTAAAGLPAAELEKVAEILRLARVTDLPTVPDDPDLDPTHTATPAGSNRASGPDSSDAADLVRNLYDPNQWAPATTTAAVPSQRGTATAATPMPVAADDSTLDTDLATWTAEDANPPRIAILGRVEVAACGIPPDKRKALLAEIAVYLAAHPRGASQWEIGDALWPNGINDKSVRVFAAGVRRWLGHTPDREPWLPDARDTNSLYQLRPGYLLDWHLLRRLKTRARQRGHAGIEDLRAALALVRGRPLAGADSLNNGRNQYSWLGESDINPPHILAVIVDTAHHLAQLHLEHGDTVGARWAVHQSWIADPDRSHDEPWLDLMHAEQIDGNRAELRQLREQLLHARDAEVPEDLAPATFREVDGLLRG